MWPEILTSLDAEPDQTGMELFERLRSNHPDDFDDGQLRTLQRRLKEWRSAAARRLVFAGHDLSIHDSGVALSGRILREAPGNIAT